MQSKSDKEIMTRLQQGDVDSLGVLFERYQLRIFNYFLRMANDRDRAGDLLMEVFERVYRYRKSFQIEKPFTPWLYRIANRVMVDQFNLQKKRSGYCDRPDENWEELSWQADTEVHHAFLLRALRALGAQDQRLIQQHYLLEMSYVEMAEMEGLSVNAIRIRICRALKKLNYLLKDSGIKYSGS